MSPDLPVLGDVQAQNTGTIEKPLINVSVKRKEGAGRQGAEGNNAALFAQGSWRAALGRTLGFAFQDGCDGSSSSKTHRDFDEGKAWPSYSSSPTPWARWYQKRFLVKLLHTRAGNSCFT